MNQKSDYIAVFDSGVGGISVLRQLRKELPQERFLYFGDSANAPYGTRPTEEIRALAIAVADQLVNRGIKALVVACNTATSAAICQLRSRWKDLIVVGIEPALKPAADLFPGGNIGVMATPATLREEKFSGLLTRYGNHCNVIKLPAPGLVELVEHGKANSPETEQLLTKLLGSCIGKLDAVVLGCTHYPLASESIAHVLGNQTVLLDGGEGTARETRRRLKNAGLLSDGPGSVEIENSLDDPAMIELSWKLLGGS